MAGPASETDMDRWARDRDRCRSCGTTERPHCAKGLCRYLYTFTIAHQGVCRDLMAHGLHPRKSRTIQFPDAPLDLQRHFVRGCWDGDGSIWESGRRRSAWTASFVSGSFAFIRGIHASLVTLGMPPSKICRYRHAHAYQLRWYGARCRKLFEILYDGVSEAQYLLRKYEKFRAAAAKHL